MKGKRLIVIIVCAVITGSVCIHSSWSQIADTAHDLSSSSTAAVRSTDVNEICVFCHTPHAALSDGPLWNHSMSNAVYTVPDATDLPALLTTIQQPDKGSRLCLGCHDGTIALGLLINMPGPGSSGSATMTGLGGRQDFDPGDYGFVGTDISGTHPISTAMNDQLLADKNACDTGNTFLLQYPPDGDLVKLKPTNNTYSGQPGRPMTSPTGMAYNGGVQCATCHDPHDDTNGDFLVKGAPGASAPLCDTCHYQLCP